MWLLLEGSWVVISRVVSIVTHTMPVARALIALLTTTQLQSSDLDKVALVLGELEVRGWGLNGFRLQGF